MIEIHNTVKFLIQSIVMGGAFIGEVASLVNSHSRLLLLVVMWFHRPKGIIVFLGNLWDLNISITDYRQLDCGY